MKLSIVATLYQSALHLNDFYFRLSKVAKELSKDSYEIILVNDGSPDSSLEIAINLTQIDNHIKLIDLSRNFGHHKAMMTGLTHAKGEKVFLIDSDLEEEPEWLTLFSEQMSKTNCDVVYGVQEKRRGGFFERFTGQLFYSIFKQITGLPIPPNMVTARLMTRRYVDALIRHEEREIFMAGLWFITGFNQSPYHIKKKSSSQTTYTFIKKMSLFVNSVTSFSNIPLTSIFYVGIFISVFSSAYITWLIINRLFYAKHLIGWTSVMGSIWLLGGMIISFIGVLGIYLSKIFSEIKQRPYTIIRQIYADKQD